MFAKILIANRGEIACRIIRTARRMGIATVAVYSEADAGALHVEMADETVAIGASPPAESYLRADRLLQAAAATGADALHPGFGFLSENADFARAVAEAGIAFIGPPADAIAAMGDKITSKRIAQEAGVHTVPGHAQALADADAAVKVARKLGYPVMLKAAAGGGGKGMRIARGAKELREGLRAAASEAQSAFGDARVFLERFIEQPRHIEIQVLADAHGNIVNLGERECSIQRRHQKVIEEAPSPFIDAATRAAMGAEAVALARAVGYRSAGTVEFIVDAERQFYFLEMNTRLQVEHPVTEFVTGLDLVEQMIRIAAGEPLDFTQDQVRRDGWAIEARLYAEDPDRGFLPSIGRLVGYRTPPEDRALRIDSGVVEGDQISMFYDPMIAKVIGYGATRAEATARLLDGLDRIYLRGVRSNIGFLATVLGSARFAEGRLSTAFIDEEFPDGFHGAPLTAATEALLVTVAAAANQRVAKRDACVSGQMPGGRHKPPRNWTVRLNGANHPVEVTADAEDAEDGYRVKAASGTVTVVSDWQPGGTLFRGRVDGKDICVQVERDGVGYCLGYRGVACRAMVLSAQAAQLAAQMPEKQASDRSHLMLSPMPGLLVRVAVAEGQAVKAGEELAVVEAMKMENVLRAERDGVVKTLHAAAGDSLRVDQAIMEFE